MSINNQQIDRKVIVLFFCISTFIFGLLISSITASKLTQITIFGFPIAIPVGTSLFAVTFLSTDVMSEVFGKKYASLLVLYGFLMRLLSLTFIFYAVNIPGADEIWDQQEAYSSILLGSNRILLAGILTYPISQFTDIFVFHKLKEMQKGRNLLWLRNTSSTLISQTVDSTFFIFFAFVSILPLSVMINMILGQVIIKWIISISDTPFVYLVRNYAENRKIFDIRG